MKREKLGPELWVLGGGGGGSDGRILCFNLYVEVYGASQVWQSCLLRDWYLLGAAASGSDFAPVGFTLEGSRAQHHTPECPKHLKALHT